MLDERTRIVGGQRRLVLGDRYTALPKELERAAVDAFERYAGGLDSEAPKDQLAVIDVAFRIAGTGSLGALRVAVLTKGKGGPDGAWLFDMKEEGVPSAEVLLGSADGKGAERVLAGARACLVQPPRMMGTTELDDLSMFVRRLAPQEDKLDLSRIEQKDLEGLAAYLGALLGRAHRRGATEMPSAAWSPDEQDALIERAIPMAGAHEAGYLAMCKGVAR